MMLRDSTRNEIELLNATTEAVEGTYVKLIEFFCSFVLFPVSSAVFPVFV